MWIAVGLSVGLIILGSIAWVIGVLVVARRRVRLDCPKCNSQRVRPSWARSYEGALGAWDIRPYRCESCRSRFYGPWRTRRESPDETE